MIGPRWLRVTSSCRCHNTPLDRIRLAGVSRRGVDHRPAPVLGHVLRNPFGVVLPGVVAVQVDHLVRPVPLPQVVPHPVRRSKDPAWQRFSLFPGVVTSAWRPRYIHIEPIRSG